MTRATSATSPGALEELGAWLPSRDAAELAGGSCLARALAARSR
jgi:hypothetical protein